MQTKAPEPLNKQLGITQMELARALGVDERTIRRWLAADPSQQGNMPENVRRVLLFFNEYPTMFKSFRRFVDNMKHPF